MVLRDMSRRAVLAAGCLFGIVGVAGCNAVGADGGSKAGLFDLFDRPGEGEALPGDTSPRSRVERIIASMTLEEKVAQLFIVTPEQLTGVSQATIAGRVTQDALMRYPVGGLCYFGRNIVGEWQLKDMLSGTSAYCASAGAGIRPFLAVDEGGGPLVARIANSSAFDVERFPSMAEVGASGDAATAARVGSSIGSYLREIGFNVDFAPVADVLTNSANAVIAPRSFGSDPTLVASMVAAEVKAMLETGTLACVKHFPGHGDTAGDPHTGAVSSSRSKSEIESCEFLPFKAAIDAGCPMIMVGHIETPNYAADGLPASMSRVMVTDVLRGQLGFEGVIVSDSLSMGAIVSRFSPADAAVRFFQAGGDCLLIPQSFPDAYDGVLAAVESGSLGEDRIDESVARVLRAKQRAGMLDG